MIANRSKPDGWFRSIPKSNTGVFKRMGIPFGLFVNLAFGCLFLAGWFDWYLTGLLVFVAGWFVSRHVTENDDRWYAILTEQHGSWARRLMRNRFRSFKPFLDT